MNENNMKELKKQYEEIEVPVEIDFAIENGIKRGKKHKKYRLIKPIGITAAALFLCVTLTFSIRGENFFSGIKGKVTCNTVKSAVNGNVLPTVGSANNLKKLLSKYAYAQNVNKGKNVSQKSAELGIAQSTASTADTGSTADTASKSKNANVSSDYSTTNIQVQGVDEEDVVKTDGSYIYKINPNKSLSVVKAVPASSMEVLSNVNFDQNFSAVGLFLSDKYLAVIGESYSTQINDDVKGVDYDHSDTTKVIVYDISDKKNLKQVKTVELEGNYMSSRMIDSKIFVVTNKYIKISTGIFFQDKIDGNVFYKDSSKGDKKINIDYNNIKYFPDDIKPNYIMVGSINLKNVDGIAQVSTFLGSGDNIYSSEKNLYVAGLKQEQDENKNLKTDTVIYKLAYDGGSIKCTAKGEVPGTILNQFSMDENSDYFRIATTEYNNNSSDVKSQSSTVSTQNTMSNNLYVLDNGMNIKGKIENIAPEERIYSVRFMGDRAYMVTYIQMDPLFVIDLKDTSNPKILGELKIPGFSNYLQPYDENHIIGFGKDSTVVNEGGTDRAKPLGVKIAMFDVTDVTKPVQKFVTVIGDAGTNSDVLNNHKALLLSKEKNLLALPIDDRVMGNNISREAFQGAYVYSIDLEKGLTLKGKITHADADSTDNPDVKIKDSLYGDFKVGRILYINDTLYTLSNACIKANDINTLQEQGKVLTK